MEDLIFSLIVFVIIYLLYFIFVINKRSKLEKMKDNSNVIYLINKYGLDLKKVDIKVLGHIIALTNSFILSTTLFLISFINNLAFKILGCIIILIPFQFIMYHIIGKMYEKNNQTKKRGIKK